MQFQIPSNLSAQSAEELRCAYLAGGYDHGVMATAPKGKGGEVKVTLLGSVHGQLANIAACVRGLGLRKRHQSVTVSDTPENRGMMKTAEHLLRVVKA